MEFMKIPSVVYKRIKATNLRAVEISIKSKTEQKHSDKTSQILTHRGPFGFLFYVGGSLRLFPLKFTSGGSKLKGAMVLTENNEESS